MLRQRYAKCDAVVVNVSSQVSFSHRLHRDEDDVQRHSKGRRHQHRIAFINKSTLTFTFFFFFLFVQGHGDSDVFVRSPLVIEFGMRTCLVVLVQFGGHVHSVMALFSPRARQLDADTDALSSLLEKCMEDVYSPGDPAAYLFS